FGFLQDVHYLFGFHLESLKGFLINAKVFQFVIVSKHIVVTCLSFGFFFVILLCYARFFLGRDSNKRPLVSVRWIFQFYKASASIIKLSLMVGTLRVVPEIPTANRASASSDSNPDAYFFLDSSLYFINERFVLLFVKNIVQCSQLIEWFPRCSSLACNRNNLCVENSSDLIVCAPIMVFNPCLSFVQVCHHSQTFQGKLLCVSVNIIIAECNRENVYFIFGKGSPCVLVNLFQCIGLIESIYTFKNL